MPTVQPKIYCTATLFASILLMLALWLTGATTATAKEPDQKKYGTNGLQHVNWDLRNHAGYPVGSGVYLVHVEVPGVGTIIRKAVVIMSVDELSIF